MFVECFENTTLLTIQISTNLTYTLSGNFDKNIDTDTKDI